jgi:hypothetical protein
LDVPFDRVNGVQFGGKSSAEQATARVRLTDGALIHLDAFAFQDGTLSAHSTILGDLKLPAANVAELILSPAPARFPKVAPAKKTVKKDDEKKGDEEPEKKAVEKKEERKDG